MHKGWQNIRTYKHNHSLIKNQTYVNCNTNKEKCYTLIAVITVFLILKQGMLSHFFFCCIFFPIFVSSHHI